MSCTPDSRFRNGLLMVGGNMLFKQELIEQRSLFDLPMSHHDLQPCQLDSDISAPHNRLFQQNRPNPDTAWLGPSPINSG